MVFGGVKLPSLVFVVLLSVNLKFGSSKFASTSGNIIGSVGGDTGCGIVIVFDGGYKRVVVVTVVVLGDPVVVLEVLT